MKYEHIWIGYVNELSTCGECEGENEGGKFSYGSPCLLKPSKLISTAINRHLVTLPHLTILVAIREVDAHTYK